MGDGVNNMPEFVPIKKAEQPVAEFNPVKKLDKKTGIWEAIKEEAPATLGGIAGGIVGAPGGLPGVALGVGLGAAGGEAYKQYYQQMTQDPDAPKTPSEALKKVTLKGAREAAYELGGQFVTKIAGKALKPFRKKISFESRKAIKILKDKIKPQLTPAEATNSRLLDVLENISEASLLGGGKISQFKLKRGKILEELSDDIIDIFGKRAEPDDVGKLFALTIEGKKSAFRAASNILYNNVDELSKGAKVSTKSLKLFAKPLAKIGQEIKEIEGKNAGDDLMRSVLELPDNVDFAVAKELRSRLISRIDEFSVLNKKAPAIGKAKQLIKRLDAAIEKDLKRQKPEAYKAWREANEFYKYGKEGFDNAFIRRLIKKGDPDLGGDPEAIAKAIFKPGAITGIKKVKIATDKATWRQLQSYYIQSLMAKSTNVDGVLTGKLLINNLYGKAGMGKKTLSEIFNPQQLNMITDLARTLKITQSKQAEGLGRMWIQLTQAGATATVLGMGQTPAAVPILFGPPVVARLLLNPTAVKWLTIGYKLPPNSPKLVGITTRLLAMSKRIEEEHDEYLKKD